MNIISSPIPSVTLAQSTYTKQLDLNDYYIEDRERRIIRCQICQFDIFRKDIFEHTTSKRHKYNKLFVAILQGCSPNVDFDFIVLNIDKLQCRYCNSLIINSDNNDAVINHIRDTTHVQRKQRHSRFLDEISRIIDGGSGKLDVQYNLLKPLDSLISHNKEYNRHKKRVDKKDDVKQIGVFEEAGFSMGRSQFMDSNNVEQNNISQYSDFCIKYEREEGEKLSKFIEFIEGPNCICTICRIGISKSTCNVSEHINGKKHKKKVLASVTSTASEILSMIDRMNRLLPKPDQPFSNNHGIEETIKDSRDTNNVGKINVPQSLAVSENSKTKSKNKSSDCIIIDENGALICTVCHTEVPNNSYNIDEHINGKKHKQEILKVGESIKQKFVSEDINKSIPVSVSNVKDVIYICKTCGVEVPNNSYNIEMHNKGRNHLQMMLRVTESRLEKLKLQDTKTSVLPPAVSGVKNGSYECTPCGKIMKNNENNIKFHNGSKNHKKMILQLKESTQMKSKIQDMNRSVQVPAVSNVENGFYECKACCRIMRDNEHDIQSHKRSENHIKKMLQLFKSK